MGGLVSDTDKAVLTGDFAEYLAASLRAALRTRHRRLAGR